MSVYCKDKTDVVQYVSELLRQLEEIDLPLTIVIKPDKYGGYSVSGVINSWLDGIVPKLRTFLGLPSITLTKNPQDG